MSNANRHEIQRGYGSAERPLAGDLWERDSREKILAMRDRGNLEPAHNQVDFGRYYRPEFAQLELQKLWMKTWLYACREEDIPNVGDRVPFQLGPRSFLIVRSQRDEFKAFYNSCPHRGTQLCAVAGSGDSIRCPFHSWEFKLDGALKHIPSHWDFKSVNTANGRLREVQLGRWGGFIFINADPQAPSLEAALSVMPEHFREYAPQERYTAAHFRKLVRANWKIVQEAFEESYHVVATHPQAVPFSGDTQARYDIWDSESGHVGRQITPSAVPSMHADPSATTIAAVSAFAAILKAWHYPDAELPTFDPKADLRAQLGDWHRSVQTQQYGAPTEAPDAVMIDSTLYFMFPHFALWMSESIPFAYKFTPHQTDPELSYFEVRLLRRFPKGASRPPASPVIEIGPDERIEDKAPAFSFLASVFDQDMANMPLIQAGVRSADPQRNHSQLGTYQEMIIQHWNELVDRYLAR